MNETLSDEEIKNWRLNLAVCGEYSTLTIEQAEKALNTIEVLKAENQHLKSVMLKQPMNFELEAKDAQIKQLVDALTFYTDISRFFVDIPEDPGPRCNRYASDFNLTEETYWESDAVFGKTAKQALSTVPDVEGYRLEREVVEAAISYVSTHISTSNDHVSRIEFMRRSSVLDRAVTALEAHREKVKNEST